MNTNQISMMKRTVMTFVTLLGMLTTSFAGLREPDVVIWGTVIINKVAMTAVNTDVVVEARRTVAGPAIASYRMGSSASAGDFYTLRLICESGLPLTDPNAVLQGDSLYLVVKNDSGDKESKPIVAGGRGTITRIDFGALDADNDGLLDNWETQYFGGNSGNPSGDNDLDGANNLREFLEGTNPLVMDARHPADRDPIDARIAINEVTSYGLAWRNNLTWPTGPVPIPMSYITKAGAIWKGGELYKLDTNVSITAPLWWTNIVSAGFAPDDDKKEDQPTIAASASTSSVTRTLSAISGGFIVHLDVAPKTGIAAFAVEEQIPAGWTAADISDGGGVSAPQNTVRWGLYLDGARRDLVYRLTPIGAITPQAIRFIGSASFDGFDIAIGGIATLADPTGGLALGISALAGHAGTTVTIRGIPGQAVTIESSTNLTTWSGAKQAIIGVDGTVQLPFTFSPGVEFFRARTGAL